MESVNLSAKQHLSHQPEQAPKADKTMTKFIWSVLPEEALAIIFSYLKYNELIPLMCLDQRSYQVIEEKHLIPRAYWHQSSIHPTESVLTRERYQRGIRQWLLDCGKKPAVKRLDSLQRSKDFPKILFHAKSKIMDHAENFKLTYKYHVLHDYPVDTSLFNHNGQCLVSMTYKRHANGSTNCLVEHDQSMWVEKYRADHSASRSHAQHSPDKRHLIIYAGQQIDILAADETGNWSKKFQIDHQEDIFLAQFDSTGHTLVTASCDGTVCICSLDQDNWIEKKRVKHGHLVRFVCFSPNNCYLVTCSLDQSVFILSRDEQKNWHIQSMLTFDYFIQHIAFSPNGNSLVLFFDNITQILTLCGTTWRVNQELTECQNAENSRYHPTIDFIHNGRYLMTIINNSDLGIYTENEAQWVRTYGTDYGREHSLNVLNLSPDQRNLVTGNRDGFVCIHTLDPNEQWKMHNSFEFGTDILVRSYQQFTRFRDFSRNDFADYFNSPNVGSPSPGIRAALFSPDNINLLIVTDARIAYIIACENREWKLKNFQIVHTQLITAANFSSDGRFMGTASMDGTAYILTKDRFSNWIEIGKVVHGSSINHICFSPDSLSLVTSSDNKTARISNIVVDEDESNLLIIAGINIFDSEEDESDLLTIEGMNIFDSEEETVSYEPLMARLPVTDGTHRQLPRTGLRGRFSAWLSRFRSRQL